MKNKSWGSRFSKPQTDSFLEYGASISFDKKLANFDIAQNIAQSEALNKAGLLTGAELKKILKGLRQIEQEIAGGSFLFSVADEDIHMNIESALRKKIGAVAGKIHTGRSRNDQVATDIRLYVREHASAIAQQLHSLQKTILKRAEKYLDNFMPAYTHLQMAQPIRIAHWYLAYQQMFARDEERFINAAKQANIMPLGSGALVGNNFGLNRKAIASRLGFKDVTRNSLDAVSDRDFGLDFCHAVSLLFIHLSRLSEELIIYSSAEFSSVSLPDELCTGSSIMPQKKNPDLPELLRGKAGRVAGNQLSLLMLLKGLPLAYNKDMQEDKPPIFDSAEQAITSLPLVDEMLSKMKWNVKLLRKRIEHGFITAVDIADYLALKDMPFRDAHHVVGAIVKECEDAAITFEQMPLEAYKKHSKLFEKDIYKFVDPTLSPDRKKGIGSTSRTAIASEIKRLKKVL